MLPCNNVQRAPRTSSGTAGHWASSTAPSYAAPWLARGARQTFLRCLKLLDLDLLDDWPAAKEGGFLAKPSQQNLQQRLKFVEWSLYRLFEIWDPAYSKDKLRLFFPPLAPLQSLNLRAALLRGLTDLKRQGVLGKDVTLRKTMLDECKGEKFEDVLRIFVLAVLRREARGFLSGRAESLEASTLHNGLGEAEDPAVLPLLLAHASHLQQTISGRKEVEGRFRAQEAGLRELETTLQQRNDEAQILANSLPVLKPGDIELYQDLLTGSWTGNNNWIEVLVNGGPQVPSESKLPRQSQKMPFVVENRHCTELLMANLNGRIAQQQSRLQEWRAFGDSLPKLNVDSRSAPASRVPLLSFGAHLSLCTEDINQSSGQESSDRSGEIPRAITDMRDELAGLWKYRKPMAIPPSPFLEPTCSHNESLPPTPKRSDRDRLLASATKSEGPPVANLLKPSSLDAIGPGLSSQSDVLDPPAKPEVQNFVYQRPAFHKDSARMSIAERTRLSMALLPPFGASTPDTKTGRIEVANRSQNMENRGLRSRTPEPENEAPTIQSMPLGATTDRTDDHEDYTRRRMSATTDARNIKPRTPSPRKAPSNMVLKNERTVQLTSPDRAHNQNTPSPVSKGKPRSVLRPRTPAASVDLNLDTSDYASVFKSRPRVAVSPPPSPSPPRSEPAILNGVADSAADTEDDVLDETFNSQSSPIRGWR